MAIQPVDLQLAYLAAPASAAVASNSQTAPAAAQQAAQAVFAAQVEQREETIQETQKAEGSRIHADRDGGGNAGTYSPRKRRRDGAYQEPDQEDVPQAAVEQHFIDTTA